MQPTTTLTIRQWYLGWLQNVTLPVTATRNISTVHTGQFTSIRVFIFKHSRFLVFCRIEMGEYRVVGIESPGSALVGIDTAVDNATNSISYPRELSIAPPSPLCRYIEHTNKLTHTTFIRFV